MFLIWLSSALASPFPMWGVGVTAQTNLYPFGYPLAFPSTCDDCLATPKDLETASYVVSVGGKFVGYLNRNLRGAFRPVYSFGSEGSGYSALSASLELDKIVSDYNGIHLFLGGGLGTGSFTFEQDTRGTLSGRNLFIRGHGGALMSSRTTAWEVALFAELGFVGEEKFAQGSDTYTNRWFSDEKSTSLGGGWYYPILGVEISGYFGNFLAAASHKNKRKKRTRRR